MENDKRRSAANGFCYVCEPERIMFENETDTDRDRSNAKEDYPQESIIQK